MYIFVYICVVYIYLFIYKLIKLYFEKNNSSKRFCFLNYNAFKSLKLQALVLILKKIKSLKMQTVQMCMKNTFLKIH